MVLAHAMPDSKGVTVIPLSALKKRHLTELPQAVIDTYNKWNTR
jgi:predicted GTPase